MSLNNLPERDIEPPLKKSEKIDGGRRQFLLQAISALILSFSGILTNFIKQAEAQELQELTDQEKINNFAKHINSLQGQIPQIDEKKSQPAIQQSYQNIINLILKNLAQNEELVDPETYAMFAYLINEANGKTDLEENVLKDLTRRFAQNGWFFDVYSQVREGDPFVKIQEEKQVSLADYQGVMAVFGEEVARQNTSLLIIDNPARKEKNYKLGTTQFGFPVINLADVKRYFETRVKKCLPNTDFWRSISAKSLQKNTEANELAHHILYFVFNFMIWDNHNWGSIKSGLEEHKLHQSIEVHEFFSDAVSLNTCGKEAMFILYNNLLRQSSALKKDQTLGRYNYSAAFFKKLLEDKLGQKTVDTAIRQCQDAQHLEEEYPEKYWTMFFNTIKQILDKIGEKELKYFQEEYTKQAKILLQEIKSITTPS